MTPICTLCGQPHTNSPCAMIRQCTICGSQEAMHLCGGTPTLPQFSNPMDPLALSCEIESLRKKLAAAELQVRELEMKLGRTVRGYQQEVADANRLNDALRWALEDCLELLKNVDEQVGPERMKQFRVDPYGTIEDAKAALAGKLHKTERPKCDHDWSASGGWVCSKCGGLHPDDKSANKRNHDSKPGRGEAPGLTLPCLPLEAGLCGCESCVKARAAKRLCACGAVGDHNCPGGTDTPKRNDDVCARCHDLVSDFFAARRDSWCDECEAQFCTTCYAKHKDEAHPHPKRIGPGDNYLG